MNNTQFSMPGVGPDAFGAANWGNGFGGAPANNATPAAPEPPKTFDDLMRSSASSSSVGTGNTPTDQKLTDANNVLALFGQMLSAPAATTATTPATVTTPATTTATPPTAEWEALFKDFSPSVADPDFISNAEMLGKLISGTLDKIDFKAGLESADPNLFMRGAIGQVMSQAVQLAFLAAKEFSGKGNEAALREYAKRSYSAQQLGAVSTIDSVPQSMGFVAKMIAQQYTAAKPNATPADVAQAVKLVMTNLQQAFQPAAASTAPSVANTDWMEFLGLTK